MIGLSRVDYETNTYHFVVDTVSELDLLPRYNISGQDRLNPIKSCSIGSTAMVTSDSARYILNGEQNKWIKFTGSSGGGSGDIDFATDDEVRKALGL